jgi:microcystin-dependent protein
MGLESATYLSELNATNPTGTDLKSQGDDHLRLIKSVLQATFPNASRAFRIPNSVAAQTANYSPAANICDNLVIPCNANSGAFTVTLPATPGVDGLRVFVIKTDSSSNAVTISGNGNLINAHVNCTLNGQFSSKMLVWCAAASIWAAVGGGGHGAIVGEFKAYSSTTAPCGWLRCNGQTIGSAASAATRANADTEALYRHLWGNYSNSVCAVSSGRGASAAADFAANKTLALPDLRGRGLFGLDDMGSSAAGRLAGATIDQTTNGATGGADTVTLSTSNLPSHTHDVVGNTGGQSVDHTHQVENSHTSATGPGSFGGSISRYSSANDSTTGGTSTDHSHPIAFPSQPTGSGAAVDKLPPCFLVTWLITM